MSYKLQRGSLELSIICRCAGPRCPLGFRMKDFLRHSKLRALVATKQFVYRSRLRMKERGESYQRPHYLPRNPVTSLKGM